MSKKNAIAIPIVTGIAILLNENISVTFLFLDILNIQLMRKIYYLSTCSTCNRIIKELGLDDSFEFQDIKTNKITTAQIEEMKKLSGSYESLFSKRAMKYKSLGLKDKMLSENDIKEFILDEYTFLKRPVIIVDNKIFIGNSKKTVLEVAQSI